jgi:hypothetical protein
MPVTLSPEKNLSNHLNRRLGWPQELMWIWATEKPLASVSIQTPDHPVHSLAATLRALLSGIMDEHYALIYYSFIYYSGSYMFRHLCAIFRERHFSFLCAQLDKVMHETTTSGAHRPTTFTVHGYIPMTQPFSDFQVTRKDKGRSTCRSLNNKWRNNNQCIVLVHYTQSSNARYGH